MLRTFVQVDLCIPVLLHMRTGMKKRNKLFSFQGKKKHEKNSFKTGFHHC